MKGGKLWNLVNTDKIEKELKVRIDYDNCLSKMDNSLLMVNK